MAPLVIVGTVGLLAVAAWAIRRVFRWSPPTDDKTDDPDVEPMTAPVYDPEAVAVVEEVPMTIDPADRIIDYTARTEGRGRYDALNRNTDGAGASLGLIQFAQKPGGLGRLLGAMYERDPDRFTTYFGDYTHSILAITQSDDKATRMSLALWEPPFIEMLRASGRDEVFQQIQRDLARTDYYDPALAIAMQYGIRSERGLSLLFDTAVQQGAEGALPTIVKRAAAKRTDTTTEPEFLALIAQEAVDYASVKWKDTVRTRRFRILADPNLSDAPVI